MSERGSPAARPRAAWWLSLACAFALGAWLRLHQIGLQIVCDDELHAVRFLLEHGAREILASFGASDHSIPLTLLELGIARTVGLSELWMRAPPLLAGLVALVALPLALRPLVGGRGSAVLAWLLALSPLHVYFSRYARPYAITFLLASLGTLAFLAWWRGGRRRLAAGYALCAVLGPWFHLVLLPYALAPLAWAALRKLLRRAPPAAPGWAALGQLALAVGAGLALLLLPPLLGDPQTLAERAGAARPAPGEVLPVFELISGAHLPPLAFAFGFALLHGLFALRRRAPDLLGLLAFGLACQLAAILVAGPDAIDVPIVLARYLLPTLLLALLAAALGLAQLDELLRGELRWWPPHALPAAVLAALLLYGPMAPLEPRIHGSYYEPNSWTNHALFQYQYGQRQRRWYLLNVLWSGRMSAFYEQLANRRRAGEEVGEALVEAPWIANWGMTPMAFYQRIHRLPVRIGFLHEPGEPLSPEELPLPDPRFAMRHFVGLGEVERMRREGVRFVVLHKQLTAEIAQPGAQTSPDPSRWIERYRAWFGSPAHEDALVCVFDLSAAPGGD